MVEQTDPVSGNEVPVGAKPEEVRDDVPIMASEGEYVIPANVVRFYGVNHFEKLIKKAQEGLDEMEANGRMGGEKEEGPQDDLPFSDEELMVVEDVPQMAEGGLVPDAMDPSQWTTGFSTFNPNPFDTSKGSGVQSKIYRNPVTGERRVVMYLNGVAVQEVPKGFVEDTPQNKQTQDEVQKDLKESGINAAEAESNKSPVADWAGMNEAAAGKTAKAGQNFAGMIGGMIGGLPGATVAKGLVAREQYNEMISQGKTEAEAKAATGYKSDSRSKGLLSRTFDNILSGKNKSRGISQDQYSRDLAYAGEHGLSAKDVQDSYDPYSAYGDVNGEAASAEASSDYSGNDGEPEGHYGGYRKGGLVSKKKSPSKRKSKKGLGC